MGELAPINYQAMGVTKAQLESEYVSPGVFNDFTKNGQIYGVPEELSDYNAFVNKSYFAAAGLSLPKTWAQVCADGPKMQVKNSSGTVDGDEVAFPVNFPAGLILVMNAIASEFGEPLFNASGTQSNLTKGPVVAAFQMVQNLVYKCHAFDPSLGGTTATIERTLFAQGSTAIVLDVGSWFTTSPTKKVQSEDAVTPYPTQPGRPSYSPDYQNDWTVQAGTANQALSWKYVRYITQNLGKYAFSSACTLDRRTLRPLPRQRRSRTGSPSGYRLWLRAYICRRYSTARRSAADINDAYESIILNDANVSRHSSANSQIQLLLNH